MTTDDTPAPAERRTDDGLISDADDRYNLIGLDIVDNDTGIAETFTAFRRDEIDMPGYIETVEKQYKDTKWHPVRVWRTTTRPQ